MADQLKHAPLVEAIFEARWSTTTGSPTDPHYKLFVGRLFDRLQPEFPEPEELPAAQIPEGLVSGLVQQRFRASKDGWPLVQVGPGVITLNHTAGYEWAEFQDMCINVIERFFKAHPKPETIRFSSLQLRYIDAIPLGIASDDVWTFLRTKMRVSVSFPDDLFTEMPVEKKSDTFHLQATFLATNPPGRVALNFNMGKNEDKPALIWETTVMSVGDDVPKVPEGCRVWLDAAHNITHTWFQKLITGELEKTFRDA